jgi:hypothetical protein
MVPRVEPRLQPPPTPRNQSSNSAKHSTRSYSSSFEADDERSSTADHDSMGPNSAAGFRDEPSQYEGEDIRLTSRKELSGWYAYAFAAEVFVICGMGELKFPGRCVVRGVVDGFCCKCFQRPGLCKQLLIGFRDIFRLRMSFQMGSTKTTQALSPY